MNCAVSRSETGKSRTNRAMKNTLLAGLLATGCSMIPFQADAELRWRTGAVELEPSARLDLDYAAAASDASPIDDNFLYRRVRIGLDGKVYDHWSFEFGYDFADQGEYKDVNVEYDGFSAGGITAGQFKAPFGLGEMTSSRNLAFVERPLPIDAFRISRRLGVGFANEGARHGFSVMGFGPSIDGDEGHGAAARFTFTPIDNGTDLLHLGFAVATERPRHHKEKFNADPEAKALDVHLVSTGKMRDVKRVNRAGVELAWQRGLFTATSEWMLAQVDRGAHANALLTGWYVSGSWLLNGGRRTYKHGRFKGVTLVNPWTTWEMAVRYSRVDLNDGALRGGRESDITIGLNWYIADHGRVMFNYIKAFSDRRGVSDDPDIIAFRVEFLL